MIDIHSHILWGLDDGAKTLDDSLAMLRMAAEAGTTDIVATPHANLQYPFNTAEVAQRLDELKSLSSNGPRVHHGCDFHLHHENIKDALANPAKYTVNNKRYLLVEFSDLLIFRNTSEIFGQLQDAGMIPVITHPERNPLLQQRLDDLHQWVRDGARLQITAQSLLGRFGKTARTFSDELVRSGIAHIVASDAHDTKHRPPGMREAFEHVQSHYGARLAHTVFILNPTNVLTGDPIEPALPAAERKRWFLLGR